MPKDQADPFSELWPLPDREQPEWSVWNPRASVQLWEAAALSLDISPIYFKQRVPETDGDTPWHFEVRLALSPETARPTFILKRFNDLIETLLRASDAGLFGSQVGPVTSAAAFRSFSHEAVFRYLRRANLTLPGQWMPLSLDDAISSGQWPWGDYETEMLKYLKATVDRWWVPYHEKRVARAPTQKEVINWLTNKGVSEKKAKAIAQVLHTDDPLPPGPRR